MLDLRTIPLLHDTRESVVMYWKGDTLIGYHYHMLGAGFLDPPIKVMLDVEKTKFVGLTSQYSFGTCVRYMNYA